MRSVWCAVFLTLILVPPTVAGPVRSEVRLYFTDPVELSRKLGDGLGELDVCTQGRTADGRDYLVVNVDAAELRALRAAGLEVEVTWPDIRDKFRAMTGANPDDGSFRDFGYFLTYWEMRDSVTRLAQNYPDLVAIDSMPRSFQNRRFYVMKISDNPNLDENEPQVLFTGATHAREPMSTHACVAFATLLCTAYARDSMTRWLVDNREIFISPVQNPDGYIYNSDSGGSSANWRKNRNNTSPRTGPGVDLNRNFGYKWALNNSGSSGQPTSETYRGPSRFSEPETQVARDIELVHKFRVIQDFHTYGRYNLLPWGFSTAWPATGAESLAWRAIADTMEANNSYTTGPTMRVLYETNGGSSDWAYADTLWEGVRKFVSYGVSSELGTTDFWYGANNPSYVDNELSLNMPNCFYLARIAGVYLAAAGLVVNDTSLGNGTGELDPGETAELWFTVKNQAVHPLDTARSVRAVLVPLDTAIRVLTPSFEFPDIPRLATGTNHESPCRVQCSERVVPGTQIGLRLELTYIDDGVTITQPVEYRIRIGSNPGLPTEPTPGSSSLLLAALPNPARGRVVFQVSVQERKADPEIAIYSRSGVLIQTLRLSGGGQQVVWNRADAQGRPVPAGVYFVQLLSGCSNMVTKFVLTD